MRSYLVLHLIAGLNLVLCRTIYVELNTVTNEELSFLKKYGYLPEEQGDLDFAYTPNSISEALKKMQAFAGLPQTGAMDAETKTLFGKKRCGVKDIQSPATALRNRRYILQKAWDKYDISYRVLNGSSTLPQFRVESLMAAGLAVWAPHGGLQFTRLDQGHADIQVSFASRDHGDGFPFDGPGRVVAHAFPPPHGAMHFDDDEVWGDNPDEEDADTDITDFFAVAVHEIGHALGLSHSTVKASVMYPYYQVPVEKLHMDDILGMQKLYLKQQESESGESTGRADTRTSLAPRFTIADSDNDSDSDSDDENYIPDLCMTNYDTIQVIHNKVFVFEEEWVWVLRDRNQLEEGYPKLFHEVFIGLPKHFNIIKTIYERENRNVVIFSGRSYWEFAPSFHLVALGNISEYSIPSQVPELTTVFLSNYNNKTYLIEEERFWRFDERTHAMDAGYPKEMSAWRDVPYPVDGAMIWKGDTYFFQGPRFWRFDNEQIRAHEYYPLPTAQIWFHCNTTPDMNNYITNDGP